MLIGAGAWCLERYLKKIYHKLLVTISRFRNFSRLNIFDDGFVSCLIEAPPTPKLLELCVKQMKLQCIVLFPFNLLDLIMSRVPLCKMLFICDAHISLSFVFVL